jgi:protein tyrosine phosphatase
MDNRGLSQSTKKKREKPLKPTDIIRSHWKSLTNNNNWQGLTDEFLTLESKSSEFKQSSSAAELNFCNRAKNRYTNVLAADETRVIISPDENNSDYINANWIEGQLTKYIAAQGPLDDTINDFWKMIWEHDVSVIAMLTREVENGHIKCAYYWPTESGIFGNLRVSQIRFTEDVKQVLHRTFTVTNIHTEESRVVQHFQYTGWPDHGLPESPEAFIFLVGAISTSNVTKGPIVVHCSAGIGRTGTLCCVDIITTLLQKSFKDGLNGHPPEFFSKLIFNTILELRKQRAGMVQTREQYYFCYLAVLAMNNPSFRNALLKKKQEIDEQQAIAEAAAREAAREAEAKEDEELQALVHGDNQNLSSSC